MTRKIKVSTRKAPKTIHRCDDGPFAGHSIALDSSGDGKTAWLIVNGEVGRYDHGYWRAAK